MPDNLYFSVHNVGRYSITTVMVNVELLNESSCSISFTDMSKMSQDSRCWRNSQTMQEKFMRLGAYSKYYSHWTIKQWLMICISAHADSNISIHSEMNSDGYFMERNRTLGKHGTALKCMKCPIYKLCITPHAGTHITGLGPGIAVCKLTPTVSSPFQQQGCQQQEFQHVRLVELYLGMAWTVCTY